MTMITLFENNTIIVNKNSSDEIFIKNKLSGVEMRVSDQHTHSLFVTAQSDLITPWSLNGLPAFKVSLAPCLL